jgi:hypothetical protein
MKTHLDAFAMSNTTCIAGMTSCLISAAEWDVIALLLGIIVTIALLVTSIVLHVRCDIRRERIHRKRMRRRHKTIL